MLGEGARRPPALPLCRVLEASAQCDCTSRDSLSGPSPATPVAGPWIRLLKNGAGRGSGNAGGCASIAPSSSPVCGVLLSVPLVCFTGPLSRSVSSFWLVQDALVACSSRYKRWSASFAVTARLCGTRSTREFRSWAACISRRLVEIPMFG